jgi:hypothetical protein
MRDLRIERTLWQLWVVGRMEIPAAPHLSGWRDKRVAEFA